jgi:hypothetical protein
MDPVAGAAALRDFDPAYAGSGISAVRTALRRVEIRRDHAVHCVERAIAPATRPTSAEW